MLMKKVEYLKLMGKPLPWGLMILLRPARAWFLRIASVRKLQYVCLCVCVRPRGYQ